MAPAGAPSVPARTAVLAVGQVPSPSDGGGSAGAAGPASVRGQGPACHPTPMVIRPLLLVLCVYEERARL